MIVLPETALNGAILAPGRIRNEVEGGKFVARASGGFPGGLIRKADAAMHRTKALSKNSIKIAVEQL